MPTRYSTTSSVAYDLKRFEARPKARIRKPALTVVSQSEKQKTRANAVLTVKVVAVCILVAGMIACMLYNRALLTELNQELSIAQSQLAEEKSEQTRLMTELESKFSLRNVEEYASKTLGMTVMDKTRVVYLNLCEGDAIELTQKSPKQTLFDRIRVAINNANEVLSED